MCIWIYHLKKCKKNWGSPCWLRSGRPKCKLSSQLRKIVKTTKWYGVKAMNLSARSNILRSIINALERILNHQRAINFIWQCFQGKNSEMKNQPFAGRVSLCFLLYKSSGNHQKVMLRTLTLAESKDIHQPRQPGWDACGFIKYILLPGPQAHCQNRKTYVLHEQCLDIA